MRAIRRFALLLVVALGSALGAAAPAVAGVSDQGEPTGDITFVAVLDGQAIDEAFSRDPVQLDAGQVGRLELEVTNVTGNDLTVGFLRIDGQILDLTFLRYDLALGLSVPAGETRSLDVPLDFFGLDEAATGYLEGAIVLFDGERNELARQVFPLDVRGGSDSTLAIFSIVILVVAVVSLLLIALNLSRRRLPANRIVRTIQFGLTGATLGLTYALAVSTLRITFASSGSRVSVIVVLTIVGLVAGFLAPGPARDDDAVLLAELETLAGRQAERDPAPASA